MLVKNGMADATGVNEIASRDVPVLGRVGALRREPSGHHLFRADKRRSTCWGDWGEGAVECERIPRRMALLRPRGKV